MKNLTLIGRIAFSLPFFFIGIIHFVGLSELSKAVVVPGAGFSIILVGIVLIAISISILSKKFVQLSTIILAIVLFIIILFVHMPIIIDDATPLIEKKFTYLSILRDFALLGASLLFAGLCWKIEQLKKTDNKKEI